MLQMTLYVFNYLKNLNLLNQLDLMVCNRGFLEKLQTNCVFHLLKRLLDEGLLPKDWKRPNMIPIFKNSEIFDPGNYWPISLTSTVCKFFEFIIKEFIIEHMT